MKTNRKNIVAVFSGICMLILILDSKLVLDGAVEGIKLSLWTVVPSLFPFFVVSPLISGSIGGKVIRLFRPIGMFCKIPSGSEGILITGILGGYPIGAQSIMQAYSTGGLSKQDALRMLSFCSNAGPAFIFGMVSQLFDSAVIAWYLWLIVILSSVFVAVSIPGKRTTASCHQSTELGFPQLIANAVKAISNVCAWVILFRIILTFLQKRVLFNSHPFLQTVLFGFLELSNGIVQASSISDSSCRFVLCAVFLSAGGLCVAMQTSSITKTLGLRTYLAGKAFQTVYAFLLSVALLPVIFPCGNSIASLISALICLLLLLFSQVFKKSIAFSKKVVYNIEN